MALYGAHKDRGELRIHESLDELSTDLAAYVAELSEVSVKERGVFTIALSGGSLIGLMGKLCEAPYNKTVDWAKWYIFWADERVVAKSHSDSNYKLLKYKLDLIQENIRRPKSRSYLCVEGSRMI
ncbi:6-phosphogluconolactonase 1 [Actinidia rufa]|uniref:6-phosphogluconolactonase 1 n=1 Tax=Actinidia rufa TaxID=165716 RepID=A0A7J0FI96_9ERIC|nr:6-phosphogluconolactonase 1 [Actinidia rufa]